MQKVKTRRVRTVRNVWKEKSRRFVVTLLPVLVAIAVFYLIKFIE